MININNCPFITFEETNININPDEENIKKNVIDYENNCIKNKISINYSIKKKINYNNILIKVKDDNNIFKDNIALINYNNLIKFIKLFDEKIKEQFGRICKNKDDIEIKLDFKIKKNYNSNLYNITCKYYLEKSKSEYKDENIFLNGLNEGFQELLCDIKYELIE